MRHCGRLRQGPQRERGEPSANGYARHPSHTNSFRLLDFLQLMKKWEDARRAVDVGQVSRYHCGSDFFNSRKHHEMGRHDTGRPGYHMTAAAVAIGLVDSC